MNEKMTSSFLRLDEESQFTVEDWYLPEFDEAPVEDEGATNALGMKPDWYEEKNVDNGFLDEEIEPTPLTAEELEAIRQSAYDEGYAEGKAQGYQDGFDEGKTSGHEQGLCDGLVEGREQGLAQGQDLITNEVQAWEQLQAQLQAPLQAVNEQVEYELIRVATGLAEELIKTQITLNPGVILQTLKQAIDALPVSEQKITITINPADLTIIQAHYPPEECEKRHWTFIAEPTIKQGDLQINTDVSSVEIVMDQRIKQLMRRFLVENMPGSE